MTGFVIGATLLVLATLALLLQPFFRRLKNNDLSRQELNAAIYRDQFAELESDRAEGALTQDDYVQARTELQRRLIEDSSTATEGVASTAASGRAVPIALAISLPLVAVLLYLMLGSPAGLKPPPPAEQQFSAQEIERMVSGLAAKLENEPGNLQGWAMLARSYRQMGRMPDAVRAYERVVSQNAGNADLLVEYADTLASASGFNSKVLALIDKALQLEPNHPIGLWLRGTAAYESQQYAKAIADWETLLKLVPPESEDANVLRANIAETKGRLGKAKP